MEIDANVYQYMESCLKELSDIEFQKRIWIRGEGPEVSSYVEVVCQLFDDTGIGDELSKMEDGIVLSEDLDPVFWELRELIDSIDYREGVENILNLPKWPKVIELASRALKLLEIGELRPK